MRGADQITMGAGGAGVGLYITFFFAQQLIINLQPNVATEFIAVFDLKARPGRSEAARRSFNIFTLGRP